MNQLSNAGHSSVFESIKKINEQRMEYWSVESYRKYLNILNIGISSR